MDVAKEYGYISWRKMLSEISSREWSELIAYFQLQGNEQKRQELERRAQENLEKHKQKLRGR